MERSETASDCLPSTSHIGGGNDELSVYALGVDLLPSQLSVLRPGCSAENIASLQQLSSLIAGLPLFQPAFPSEAGAEHGVV